MSLFKQLLYLYYTGIKYPQVSFPSAKGGQSACNHVCQPGGLHFVQVTVHQDCPIEKKCIPSVFSLIIVMQCFALNHRHHTYKKTDHKNIELTEVGPRFEMKCE